MTASQDAIARGFGLNYDNWGRLVLIDSEGVRHIGVEPVRAFPLSQPRQSVSICNSEGQELVCVPNLDDLPAAVRQILEEDLSRREFLPVIRRIIDVSTNADPSEWEVETDRGLTRFLLKSGDDVRRLGPYRALILDAHGVRFLLDDTRQLDSRSRRILENWL